MRETIYASISGTVLALEAATGRELWRRELHKGAAATTLMVRGSHVIAAAAGAVWALHARTGEIAWHNPLKGLGYGFICFAGGPGALVASSGDEAVMVGAIVAAATSVDASD